jgi:hypothetical protein
MFESCRAHALPSHAGNLREQIPGAQIPEEGRFAALARPPIGPCEGCGTSQGREGGQGGELPSMAVPDELTLKRHRDLVGRERRPYVRWVLLSLIGLVLLLGLLNTFGQRPETHTAAAEGVELEVYSPERLRSGLFFMSRFTITASKEIESATLVLDPGWLEGITLNTLEPSPVGEANRNGRIALDLGRVPAGTKHTFFLHFQVNPTVVGRRPQDVDLYDGETPLLHVDRDVTIFP